MIDPLLSVYPDLRIRLRRVYASMMAQYKIVMRCTEGLRTFDEQDAVYAQGRTQQGSIVTHARGGESLHNFGCAADSCFTGGDPYLEKSSRGILLWSEFGRHSKAYGLVWAGSWIHIPDRPHTELTYGLTLKDMQEIYADYGQDGVWATFDKIRNVEVGEGWKSQK